MDLTIDVSFDDDKKKAFGAAAIQYLTQVADWLDLKEKRIDWNKGGIAVSGEVQLYGMYNSTQGVCVYLSTPSHSGVMFRKIEHMKDYSGGANQWVDCTNKSPQQLANHIKALRR